MTLLYAQHYTTIIQTILTRVFTTSVLMTILSIPTTMPTTFITRGFRLILLVLQRNVRLYGQLIRTRVQRGVTRLFPFHLPTRLLGVYGSLYYKKRRVGTQVLPFRMIRRRIQVSSSAVLRAIFFFGRHARNVTFPIYGILFPRRQVTRNRPNQCTVFLRRYGRPIQLYVTGTDTTPTPSTINQYAMSQASLTPIMGVFPIFARRQRGRAMRFVGFGRSQGVVVYHTTFILYRYHIYSSFLWISTSLRRLLHYAQESFYRCDAILPKGGSSSS